MTGRHSSGTQRARMVAAGVGLLLGFATGTAYALWSDSASATAALRTAVTVFQVGDGAAPPDFEALKLNPADATSYLLPQTAILTQLAEHRSDPAFAKLGIDAVTRGDVTVKYEATVTTTEFATTMAVDAWWIERDADCDGTLNPIDAFYTGPLADLVVTPAEPLIDPLDLANPADSEHWRGGANAICLRFDQLPDEIVEHTNTATATGLTPGGALISASDSWSGTFYGFDYQALATASAPTRLNFDVSYTR